MAEHQFEKGVCYCFSSDECQKTIYGADRIFSRVHPRKVAKEYEVEFKKIIWLSTTSDPETAVINPNDLAKISALMEGMEGKDFHFGTGVFSYLSKANGFNQTLGLFQMIAEKTAKKNYIVTAHIDPKAFTEKDYCDIIQTVPFIEMEKLGEKA